MIPLKRLSVCPLAATACSLGIALPATANADPSSPPPRPDGISQKLPAALIEQGQRQAPQQPAPQQPAAQPSTGQPVTHSPVAGGRGAPPSKCTIRGTARSDKLHGTPGRDVICGGSGNDRIDGRGGNDVIVGGSGRDVLRGGGGDDRLIARDGSRDMLDGGPGQDRAQTDGRLDRVRSVERFLVSARKSNAEYEPSFATCYDRFNYGLQYSRVSIGGSPRVYPYRSEAYDYEWVEVQSFLYSWNDYSWTYQGYTPAAYATVMHTGGTLNWVDQQGQATFPSYYWNVIGAYWAVTQLVTWYDKYGNLLGDAWAILPHTGNSDGALGGSWYGTLDPNWYCGVS